MNQSPSATNAGHSGFFLLRRNALRTRLSTSIAYFYYFPCLSVDLYPLRGLQQLDRRNRNPTAPLPPSFTCLRLLGGPALPLTLNSGNLTTVQSSCAQGTKVLTSSRVDFLPDTPCLSHKHIRKGAESSYHLLSKLRKHALTHPAPPIHGLREKRAASPDTSASPHAAALRSPLLLPFEFDAAGDYPNDLRSNAENISK
ncbi:hypothetical protein JMJ77_0007312 [Colletotrichum scovillei]|uniref:Uncharacterized protein n=1 Tax=Colletotrichum scovillei TaxID=1209932 RepID=A0A9P7RDW0_9PEZI|nr:hypothetical protein JMJ77_0007312 [Colletotrichum scovillei]KAG7074315.1 hypothetical protein JMJ76_0010798 [Colletotrichum scovillei]KAG7081022.1 hypothetical protein JMJ78_0003154 [Colletotrichum scovillei]